MSINIIIFYEMIAREKTSCEKLAVKLKEEGLETFIFSIGFEYYKAIKLSKNKKIDFIIMPWMYNDLDYELVQPFIKNNPNVIIINLHQEQIGSNLSSKILIPTSEHSKNSVVHFVWGDFFKEILLSAGVKEELVFIVGNMRADEVFIKQKNRDELAKEFGLSIDKKWIIFSESRGWVLADSNKTEKSLIGFGYDKKEVDECRRIDLESLAFTINEFNELPDHFFEEYELIYRAHPGNENPPNINSRIKTIYKYSIYDWLDSVDVNIVWGSTTIFESDAKRIPSIVYEPTKHPENIKVCGLEHYQTISSFLEINDELLESYKTRIAPKKIYERYIGRVDGESKARVKDVIVEILNNGIVGYSAKKASYSKKRYYKKFLYQKITKLFVTINILDFLKYPRTAYQLRNEIPYRRSFFNRN